MTAEPSQIAAAGMNWRIEWNDDEARDQVLVWRMTALDRYTVAPTGIWQRVQVDGSLPGAVIDLLLRRQAASARTL